MTSISIVIPAHNEAENLASLLNEIQQLELTQPYHVVVVDDGSTDTTCDTLLAVKEVFPRLTIIQHDRSYGQSAAIATGIAHATGDLIVTMDGDGQNDPADIPRLVYALAQGQQENVRMIAGYRKKRNDSAWRVLSSRAANAVRSRLLGDNTPDTGCGLKVFYRSAFLSLPFFDHMHRFLPCLIQMQGGSVVSMEVGHRPRVHGRSKYGTLDRLWVGLFDILGVRWLSLRTKNVSIKRCHL